MKYVVDFKVGALRGELFRLAWTCCGKVFEIGVGGSVVLRCWTLFFCGPCRKQITNFVQPAAHKIYVTSNSLLVFVEAEGYFTVAKIQKQQD